MVVIELETALTKEGAISEQNACAAKISCCVSLSAQTPAICHDPAGA